MSTALPRTVERVISGYRRRWRLVRVHSGFFLTVAILGAATGAAVAADRLLRLVPTARLVAFAAIVVCAVACLSWLVAWPALRRLRDRQAAAELGQRFPEAQEDLVSAVELSRERHAASPGLIRRGGGRRRGVPGRIPLPPGGGLQRSVAPLPPIGGNPLLLLHEAERQPRRHGDLPRRRTDSEGGDHAATRPPGAALSRQEWQGASASGAALRGWGGELEERASL